MFEKYGITVKDQGSRGTCSVFAIVGVLEFEYAHRLRQTEPLSVEYLNWASKMVTDEIIDGSFFNDAIDGLKKYGICSNDYFPYYYTNYTKKVQPSDAALKDAEGRKNAEIIWIKEWDPEKGMTLEQLNIVKHQINEEHPVAIGFQWPKKGEQFRRMVNGMMYVPPREGTRNSDTHVVYFPWPGSSCMGSQWFSNTSGNADEGFLR